MKQRVLNDLIVDRSKASVKTSPTAIVAHCSADKKMLAAENCVEADRDVRAFRRRFK